MAIFGTLCAIDPNPAKVNNPQVIGTFKLFAELIGHHLYSDDRLKATEELLEREKGLSELREQFIAVLGHDLRNPIAAIDAGTSRLLKEGWTARSPLVLKLMKASISRMIGLVDNVMDLARARMGGGITLDLAEDDLGLTLRHVVEELQLSHPDREIAVSLDLPAALAIDRLRLAQLFSNLVSNAITHGVKTEPVRIVAGVNVGCWKCRSPTAGSRFQQKPSRNCSSHSDAVICGRACRGWVLVCLSPRRLPQLMAGRSW